ncbi:putative toxin [Nocardioides acrostichi]|nr:putative toxin [Nocardioides acrostichi]
MYVYDAPVYEAPGNDSGQERGPPGAADTDTTYDAVFLGWHGASPRAERRAASPSTAYAHPGARAQVARPATTTGHHVVLADGDLSSFERVGVAANGGANAVRIGQAGESAVRSAFDIGPKATRVINGRTRIFDGLNDVAVSEVKNVQRLSYTRQLRDYAVSVPV